MTAEVLQCMQKEQREDQLECTSKWQTQMCSEVVNTAQQGVQTRIRNERMTSSKGKQQILLSSKPFFPLMFCSRIT